MYYKCDNCSRAFSSLKKIKNVFPNIPDLLTRLDVGGIVPAGECPHCGALVYRIDEDTIELKWTTEDVLGTAKRLHIRLTIDEARDILQTIERRHDASIGVNWDVIEAHIEFSGHGKRSKKRR